MDRLGEVVEQTLQQVKPAHKNSALRAAFPATVPVLTGYLCLGIAYGVLMRTAGYGLGWAVFLSIVCYAGSMEFVTVTLLTSAFDPVQALVMSILVNARHCFYGLSILEKYRGTGWARPFLIFGLTDETFSLVSTLEPPAGVDKGWFMFFITLLDQFYWVASAGLGAAMGSILPFSTEGVDFVMTAMFTVIFLNQWEKSKQHYSAFIGLAAPLVCLAIFGSGSFLLPSMGCILVLLLALRKPIEKAEGTEPEAEKKNEEVGA